MTKVSARLRPHDHFDRALLFLAMLIMHNLSLLESEPQNRSVAVMGLPVCRVASSPTAPPHPLTVYWPADYNPMHSNRSERAERSNPIYFPGVPSGLLARVQITNTQYSECLLTGRTIGDQF